HFARPGFWTTVRLLLVGAFKRSRNRTQHRQRLLRSRFGRAVDWQWLGFVLSIVVMTVGNVSGALLLQGAVREGQRSEIEQQGKLLVDADFAATIRAAAAQLRASPVNRGEIERSLEPHYRREVDRLIRDYGAGTRTSTSNLVSWMRDAFHSRG